MMILATDFRRQAQVCARLAEDCDDRRLAERFRKMATDLLAKTSDAAGYLRWIFGVRPRYARA